MIHLDLYFTNSVFFYISEWSNFSRKNPKTGKFLCLVCLKEYACKRGMKSHYRRKHWGDEKTQCSTCLCWFKTDSLKKAHVCDRAQCPICKCWLKSASLRDEHISQEHIRNEHVHEEQSE